MTSQKSSSRLPLLRVLVTAFSFAAASAALAQDPQPPATRPSDRPATRPAERAPRAEPRPQPGAQGRPNPQRPGAQIGQLLDRIRQAADSVGLNPQQAERVQAVLQLARGELGDLGARMQQMGPEERRQEVQAITAGVIEEIGALLTAEQRPRFREEIERMRQQAQRRGQGPPPGQPGGPPPTTRPGDQPPQPGAQPGAPRPQGGPGPRVGQYIEQITAALHQLDLSEEQKPQVETALTSLRQDIRRMTTEARENATDPQTAGQAMRQRMDQFRETLVGILTPEQAERLREEMQRRTQQQGDRPPGDRPPGDRPPGDRPPGDRPPGDRPPGEMAPGQMPMQENDPRAQRRGRDGREGGDEAISSENAFLEQLTAPPGLDIGESLSTEVAVVSLTGKQRPLRELIPRSKPLVVLLGSASSPTFRDRVADLLPLRQAIGRDADLLIIYTREQHAAGQWTVERNTRDKVEIPQHADIEARIAAAKTLKLQGEIRIEIVVDTMEDSAVKALVGESPHCAALVFAPDGRLVGRQQWLDPTGLPALVADARQDIRESAQSRQGD